MTIETQDTRMEADIKDLGLNAPRVTKEQIDELMSKVTCSTYVVEDTTTTIAVAMLAVGESNFTLAMERTACIDKRNFNADLGAKYAIESAMAAARSKLWELEGYALAKQLAEDKSKVNNVGLSYPKAYEAVLEGKSVRRKHWRCGVELYAILDKQGATKVDLRIEIPEYVDEPYNNSDADFLATDWELVNTSIKEPYCPHSTINS